MTTANEMCSASRSSAASSASRSSTASSASRSSTASSASRISAKSFARRARKRGSRGYTLVEVMMAVAVMTAGALAVMALHQVTTFGNLESRQLSTASQSAQTWVERLQRDALSWTIGDPRQGLITPAMLASTTYLRRTPPPGGASNWFVPTPANLAESWAFDHFGRDTRALDGMRYCTNVRLQWIYPASAIRADVRVWYMRSYSDIDVSAFEGCAAGTDPNTFTTNLQTLAFVYTSTVIRWTPPPGGP